MRDLARHEPLVDPRIERSRRVIRESALREFAERGYGGFTIESVASRAGVGRNTVYRHWGGKLSLIADALETLNQQPAPELPAANPRERVNDLLLHLVEVLSESSLSACVPALVGAAEHDATLREFHHRYSAHRRQALVDAIAAGIESGDFPAGIDPDVASLALAGALFYSRLMMAEPAEASLVPQLVRIVLGPPVAVPG